MSKRRKTILQILARTARDLRPGADTKAIRKATAARQMLRRWKTRVEDVLDAVRTDKFVFGKASNDRVHVFDVKELTAYEWRPGRRRVKNRFLVAAFKAIALKQLNELPRLRLVFVTVEDVRAELNDDPLVNVCRLVVGRDELETELVSEESIELPVEAR